MNTTNLSPNLLKAATLRVGIGIPIITLINERGFRAEFHFKLNGMRKRITVGGCRLAVLPRILIHGLE